MTTKNILIDAFPFFNELDLLEFRLSYLDSVVDQFIIIEATKTHSNKPKKLYFNENKNRFSKFLHKILHIVVSDLPDGSEYNDNWNREITQRNMILYALHQLKPRDNDIIITSDVDEIPDRNTIYNIKTIGLNSCFRLEMLFFTYNLNRISKDMWYGAVILNYKTLNELPVSFSDSKTTSKLFNLRHAPHIPYLRNGGWHFTNFSNSELIKYKIESFAHTEMNTENNTANEISRRIDVNNDPLLNNSNNKLYFKPYRQHIYLPDNWYNFLTYILSYSEII